MVLVDPFGRAIKGLRISVTSRCNLSCIYCHNEGEDSTGKEMSKDTIVNVVLAGSELGIDRVKLTGGEPLLRPDLEEILFELDGISEVSLTTNGTMLAERAASLKESGLSRVNISLDSLDREIYNQITGGHEMELELVIDGIEAAISSGLTPIKLNMVILKSNQNGVWDLIDFARKKGVILQLIELLDLKNRNIGGDILRIERILEERSDRIQTRDMHRRRKYFIDNAEVEVVRPIDNSEFCAHCTRLRVTSDGRIKPCLLRNDNLVKMDSDDLEEIKKLLKIGIQRREPYFVKKS